MPDTETDQTNLVDNIHEVDEETTPNLGDVSEPENSLPQTISDDDVSRNGTPDDEPDTFPRDYVEKLRDESARYRQRASKADEYAHRLHVALVAATKRLADPDDLDFDPEHLDDPERIDAAIDELLARKPHLASRKPTGEIGQGATQSPGIVDLAGLLRNRA